LPDEGLPKKNSFAHMVQRNEAGKLNYLSKKSLGKKISPLEFTEIRCTSRPDAAFYWERHWTRPSEQNLFRPGSLLARQFEKEYEPPARPQAHTGSDSRRVVEAAPTEERDLIDFDAEL
jgi:hypothetical protein